MMPKSIPDPLSFLLNLLPMKDPIPFRPLSHELSVGQLYALFSVNMITSITVSTYLFRRLTSDKDFLAQLSLPSPSPSHQCVLRLTPFTLSKAL
ncbi:hypothetical protein BCV71DRAFT_278734, partial [Rhizopus microsporus]